MRSYGGPRADERDSKIAKDTLLTNHTSATSCRLLPLLVLVLLPAVGLGLPARAQAQLPGPVLIGSTTTTSLGAPVSTTTSTTLADGNGLFCWAAGSEQSPVFSDDMTTGLEYTDGADLDPTADNLTSPLVFADSAKNGYSGFSGDEVTYTVDVPSTDSYYLWGRFYYPGTPGSNEANSFLASLDGGAMQTFGNDAGAFQLWHYDGNGGSPVSLGVLTAGDHELTIIKREALPVPPRLDVLCLTTDPAGPIFDELVCAAMGGCAPGATTTTLAPTTTTLPAPTTTTLPAPTTTTIPAPTTTTLPAPTTTTVPAPTTTTLAGPTTTTISTTTTTLPPSDGIRYEGTILGMASETYTVSTGTPVPAVAGDLYLATIAVRDEREVASVEGLGLTWTQLGYQCSGRDQISVAVWIGRGVPVGPDTVTATLVGPRHELVIAVTRYSGASAAMPVGSVLPANTNGVAGACIGGKDTDFYNVDLTTSVPDARVFTAVTMRHRSHEPGLAYNELLEVRSGIPNNVASLAIVDGSVGTPATVLVDGTFSGYIDWALVTLEILPRSSLDVPDDLHCWAAGSEQSPVFDGNMATSLAYTAGGDLDPVNDNLTAPLVFPDSLSNGFSGNSGDDVTYTVDLPSAGDWYLWGRFYYPGIPGGNDANSFLAFADGGAPLTFGNNGSAYQRWHYDGHDGAGGGPAVPLPLGSLTAGSHQLTVTKREAVSTPPRLDVLCVTADPALRLSDDLVCAAMGGCAPTVTTTTLPGPTTTTLAAPTTTVSTTTTTLFPPNVFYRGTVIGTASETDTVSTATAVPAVAGDLYLASVAVRDERPVADIQGLGLAWTQLDYQCSARDQVSVAVWVGHGVPSGPGVVTATLVGPRHELIIGVTRYAGADGATPIGSVIAANTNGIDGECLDGLDADFYAVDLTTTAPGSQIFAAINMRHRGHEPGSAYREHVELHQGIPNNIASLAIVDRPAEAPATVLVDGTLSKDVDWALVALEIKSDPSFVTTTTSTTSTTIPVDPDGVQCWAAASGQGSTFAGDMTAGFDYTDGTDLDPAADSLTAPLVFADSASNGFSGLSGDEVSYVVNVPADDSYYLWGRFYYPDAPGSNGANSFLASIDGGTMQTFGNDSSAFQLWHFDGAGGAPLALGPLTAGAHTLTIIKREAVPVPPRLDVLCLTADPAMLPSDALACAAIGGCSAGPTTTTLPAPTTTLPAPTTTTVPTPTTTTLPAPTTTTLPAATTTSTTTSTTIPDPGDLFCWAAGSGQSPVFSDDMTTSLDYTAGADLDPTADNLTAPLVFADSNKNGYSGFSGDEVTYTVNLPSADGWYLWGRFYYPGTPGSNEANSFLATMDDGAMQTFGNDAGSFQTWHYDGHGGGPLSLGPLAAGEHELTIIKREALPIPPRMDVLCLTTDPTVQPSDLAVCSAMGGCSID